MYEFTFILTYGSEANLIDTKIKEYLLNFTQECSDCRNLAMDDVVYEKDGDIYILQKEKDGTYRCYNNDQIYENLDGFTSKNEELIEK